MDYQEELLQLRQDPAEVGAYLYAALLDEAGAARFFQGLLSKQVPHFM